MKKEVTVVISGLHIAEDGQQELEMAYEGEYHEKNGMHYLFFNELQEGFTEPVRNRYTMTAESLEVRRSGPISTSLYFREGERRQSTYQVPWGNLTATFDTSQVRLDVREDRLEMQVIYRLNLNGEEQAECNIRVQVKERKKEF
ncbi:MAG: DUF1934 domain-containing protein [Lachnospiraceae bacterium]|nr:DUF1934 domain-containing protein [Lachnospiraceae bacterium]